MSLGKLITKPSWLYFLFLVDNAKATSEELSSFERVFNIFDGNNDVAINQARDFWRELKVLGTEMHYWQQDTNGRWNEK